MLTVFSITAEYKYERPEKSRSAKKYVGKPTVSELEFGKIEKRIPNDEEFINILVFYDSSENLVQLKIEKAPHLPRKLIKILELIIPFQPLLSAITINRGLDQYIIHDLSKFLHTTNITEVCFDDTFVKEGNHYILLQKNNRIQNLSLCRCKINDDVVFKLVSTLVYPQPSSKTLCILNLSSNRITDEGAKHIADMLKRNRKLFFLNIAGNRITDEGASAIFDTLMDFRLNSDEALTMKGSLMEYLKEKTKLTYKILQKLRSSADADKRDRFKRSTKSASISVTLPPPTTATTKAKKSQDLTTIPIAITRQKSIDPLLLKADLLACNELGEFSDPYFPTFTKNGYLYCYGNNVVSWLNLSYNNITYISLKKLLKVLEVQRRRPNEQRKGLLRVNIEGNNLPEECKELHDIDYLLGLGLSQIDKRHTTVKKITR